MNLAELAAFVPVSPGSVGIVTSAVAAMGYGLRWMAVDAAERVVAPLKEQLAVVSLKSDTMWSAAMGRASAAAVIGGLATMNSPLVFTDEVKSWMDHLAVELKAAFQAEWSALNDDDLALAIQRRFGDRITKEVCIPHGIKDLECLLLACAVARE
jgi:hypothetical protein